MSSNIRIQRICQHCNNEFTARTTVTKYCSHKCASRAYKDRTRKKKVEKSNAETKKIITQPVELAKRKRIYEKLYPETKHGAKNRSNNYGKDLETDNLSSSKTFTEDTAEKTGESSRNIRRSIARSEKLLPETKKGAFNQHTKVLNANLANSKPTFVEDTSKKTNGAEPIQYNIEDCYTINEILNKYPISDNALRNLINRLVRLCTQTDY